MPSERIGLPTAPEVLKGVPPAVVRALEASDALLHALNAAKHTEPYGPIIALHTLESYFQAAKRQQRRIERASASQKNPPRRRVRSSLFDDVHFYLICWTRIGALGRFIANETRWRRTGLVLRRYHREIEQRRNGRDRLEHFEERLPGAPKHKKMKVPNDLFNMSHHHATFGGNRVDVGPESIRLLKVIVDEFRQALIFDAVESLASTDVGCLSIVLQRAASTVRMRYAVRRANAMLRHPSIDS